MKKIVNFILIAFVLLLTWGCVTKTGPINELTIYSMNDFHGAIYENEKEAGISKIGKYLKDVKKKNPNNTLILSAGDMFQGTAVSSMTRGKVVVEAMNEIGFEAMTIGNHEFDWGVPDIEKFMDGKEENGEAKFPFLGANIVKTGTDEIVSFAKPYTIIQKSQVKIGVIGVIGEDQKRDILASIVEPYDFISQINTIKKYTKELRAEHGVHIVIAMTHSDTLQSFLNERMADLTGDEKIDLVINGHTHRYYSGENTRVEGAPMPYIQSGNNGSYIGKTVLKFDKKTINITDVSAENLKSLDIAKKNDKEIDQILSKYSEELQQSNEQLGIAAKTVVRDEGVTWAADVIKAYSNVDFGFVNKGGIREAGFPIKQGDIVTYGSIFKIMPFENMVNIVSLTGEQILQLASASGLFSNSDFDSSKIVSSQYYKVATIDFVFEQNDYPFKEGKDVQKTGHLLRDYMVQAVKDSVAEKGKWFLEVKESNNNQDETEELTIFTMNDFHGALYPSGYDEVGISKIAYWLKEQKKKNPNHTMILSAGDMFQGTAVSSMTRGKVVIESMNEIGFEAMTIGNHEFDWGTAEIKKFLDKDISNGESNFPFLGANIIEEATSQIADFSKPYAIIQKGPLKIGVIGLIGEDQKSDILASIVAPYLFTSQMQAIKKYAKELRQTHLCDLVIVASHSDTSNMNQQLANLMGPEKVDVVINGHTHRYYAGETSRVSGVNLPYIQSGNNGVYVGKIVLKYHKLTKTIIEVSAENIKMSDVVTVNDTEVDQILSKYSVELSRSNEVLGTAGEYVDRDKGAIWAANVIRKYANADFGFVNYGGIRAVGFPIYSGSQVTYGSIFKIMPFENMVNIVSLTGAQIKQIGTDMDLIYNTGFNPWSGLLDGKPIKDNEYYKVATLDFVFEQKKYPFMNGSNIQKTGYLFRDFMVQAVKDSQNKNGMWLLTIE